jgi:hypothetical protein
MGYALGHPEDRRRHDQEACRGYNFGYNGPQKATADGTEMTDGL